MERGSKNQQGLHVSRRMFLQFGLWITGIASTWGIFRFLSYEAPGEELLQSITLEDPSVYLRGTALFVPEVKAWLVRDENGLYAVSATCTHLGCTVNGAEDRFVCPCHGSEFTLSGKVLQGPAASALVHFQVSLSEDGRVIIDRRSTVPPTQRL